MMFILKEYPVTLRSIFLKAITKPTVKIFVQKLPIINIQGNVSLKGAERI